MDVLYLVSSQLNRSSTPAEWLEAVSVYARRIGASAGHLMWLIAQADGTLIEGEVAASWSEADSPAIPVGVRVPIHAGWKTPNAWFESPDHPTLIEDPYPDSSLLQAVAYLPQRVKGRWVSVLSFHWHTPYHFTDRDRRLLTAITQLSGPVIDSMYLMQQNQARARRTEQINAINVALTQARDDAEILAAVAGYAQPCGADLLVMSYVRCDEHNIPVQTTRLIIHGDAPFRPPPGQVFPINRTQLRLLLGDGEDIDRPGFYEDILNTPWVHPEDRGPLVAVGLQDVVILPLRNFGQWQAAIAIYWKQPHRFSEDERQVYAAILPTAAAVIARRRALLAAEEAREEAAYLYRLSEAVNAATTYDDLMQAVWSLETQASAVYLWEFENRAYEGATYLEMLAAAFREDVPIKAGERLPVTDYPILERLQPQRLWVIEDTATDPRADPVSQASWDRRNTRALIGVGLRRDGRWLGGLTFHSTQPRHFSERDHRLTLGVGDLVLAAVERIHLQHQTEAARRQAETLAQVSLALSQATDEQGILAPLASLLEGYGAGVSALSYAVSEADQQVAGFRTVALALRGRGMLPREDMPAMFYRPADYPLVQYALAHPDAPTFLEDAFHDPRFEAGLSASLAQATGWVGVIVVPLKTGMRWHGLVQFFWTAPQVFSAEMRGLIADLQQVVASVVSTRQAYLAIEDARHETEQHIRELQTVAEVSAAAAALRNEEDLLASVIDLMQASFAPNLVYIYVLDGDRLWQRAGSARREITHASGGLGPPSMSWEDGSPVALAARTRHWQVATRTVGHVVESPTTPGTLLAHQHEAELAVPMTSNEQVVGVLNIHVPAGKQFSDSEIRVMSTLADMLAVAVQNVRYFQRAHELAALEERTRLARELHDSVSQALYGIGLGAQTAKRLYEKDPALTKEPLDYVLSLAEAGLAEMRALIFELRPESLETEGLAVALAKQGASLQARHGIEVQLDLCDEPPLALSIKENLYRVAREALHNIVKHASASRVIVRMQRSGSGLLLEVADDGVGFDTAQAFPGHLGLHSMQERIRQLGGRLALESAPGQGTRLTVTLPVW
jgi:signal transduction histidine kinase